MAALATRARPVAGSRSDTLAGFLPALTAALLVAAGAELFLLRLISRVGIHIPALPWARTAYTAAVAIGTYAFPVAAVLAMATLAVTALLALAGHRRRGGPTAFLLGLPGWLLVVGAAAIGVTAHHIAVLACLAAVGGIAARSATPADPWVPGRGRRGAGAGLRWSAPGRAGGRRRHGPSRPPSPVSRRCWRRRSPRRSPRAAVAAAGAGGRGRRRPRRGARLAGNGSTTRILALWTFGLATAEAVYALVAAALHEQRDPGVGSDRRMEAAALALVALGGFGSVEQLEPDLLLSGLPCSPPRPPHRPRRTD
ncbi:MAG: hypothetical protein U0531_07100 [Dehalococcoidia bacterium]